MYQVLREGQDRRSDSRCLSDVIANTKTARQPWWKNRLPALTDQLIYPHSWRVAYSLYWWWMGACSSWIQQSIIAKPILVFWWAKRKSNWAFYGKFCPLFGPPLQAHCTIVNIWLVVVMKSLERARERSKHASFSKKRIYQILTHFAETQIITQNIPETQLQ